MADANNNRLVAAHLAQALIAKLPTEDLSAIRAVELFHEVLEELDGMRKDVESPNATQVDNQVQSTFYESSNGDVWSLARDPETGRSAVRHQPNTNSGGSGSYIDVDRFLREAPAGPQHQALANMLKDRPLT